MVASTDFIFRIIDQYIHELKSNHIPVQQAILFGSYVNGNPREESDIDVAIISTAFSGNRFDDRRKILPLRRKIDSRIEPIPFRPDDFENGGTLAEVIKKTGIVLEI